MSAAFESVSLSTARTTRATAATGMTISQSGGNTTSQKTSVDITAANHATAAPEIQIAPNQNVVDSSLDDRFWTGCNIVAFTLPLGFACDM